MSRPPELQDAIAALAEIYPPSPPPTDPLAIIVWENVGYLIDDRLRGELFEDFLVRVGLDPIAIVHAPQEVLAKVVSRGRMPQGRAARLRSIGEIVLSHAGGDLPSALRSAEPKARRKLLKLFPGIGDPGADKILLFCGFETRPALESNGLRTLVRLGLVSPDPDYGRCYRAAISVLEKDGRMERDWFVAAYQVLRAHGQVLCRRKPLCPACPMDPVCLHQPAPGT